MSLHLPPAPRPTIRQRTLALSALGLALAATSATAQTAPPAAAPPADLGYRTVADALAGLRSRDGNGTIVTESDGWVVINEPLATAQWSFTPKGHEAYPAVVRRVVVRGPDRSVRVDVVSLCEAPAEACTRLRQEFEAMNERIVQSVKARGRTGSTPPPTAPN